jgi:hypothetical protein
MTSLIVGASMLGASILLFLVVFAASRRPVPPAWMGDNWVANIHAPLMLALFTFGIAYLIKFGIAMH